MYRTAYSAVYPVDSRPVRCLIARSLSLQLFSIRCGASLLILERDARVQIRDMGGVKTGSRCGERPSRIILGLI